MKTKDIKPRVLLSTIWIVILFNMIVRDLHQFLHLGYIEEMMALKIPDATMLIYGVIAEIPILMILLSRILKANTNKWYNTIAAVVTSLGLLSTLPKADLDDVFFVIVQNILLLIVLRVAWKLGENDTDYKPIQA